MGITAKAAGSGGDFEPLPEGVHVAVCFALYDLGTHTSTVYNKDQRQVLVMWEVPEERIEIERDGKALDLPWAISKFYTLSLHEKANLRRDLESWRGQAFKPADLEGWDLGAILGASCQLQVIHEEKGGKTRANVKAVMALPKGVKKLKPENEPRFFSFEDGAVIPDDTPEWVEKIIKESHEWAALTTTVGSDKSQAAAADNPHPATGEDEDETLPF